MRAQMVTGMFQYEPCELRVENKVLYISFPKTDHQFHISAVVEACLLRNRNGQHQLQLSTPSRQYEFLVEDEQMEEDVLAVLLELTRGNSRLELRSTE